MNIAVFIDGDNIPCSEIENIIEEIRNHGRIITANVYGDWSQTNMQKWMVGASENGIINIQCDRLGGKNSTDIKLMLDMLKVLYTNDVIDIYFIVTSDSDYRHVVSEIKLKGKLCFCLGSNKTNASLQNSCDKFIKIENLNEEILTFTTVSTKQHGKMLQDIRRLLSVTDIICMSKVLSEWERKYQFDYREYNHPSFSSFFFHNFGSKLHQVNSMVELK